MQHNLGIFEAYFLAVEAVLHCQNSTKQSLSSSTNLLTPSLNFLRTIKTSPKINPKPRGTPHGFLQKSNDLVFDLENRDFYYSTH
jgi:hypothetical protein